LFLNLANQLVDLKIIRRGIPFQSSYSSWRINTYYFLYLIFLLFVQNPTFFLLRIRRDFDLVARFGSCGFVPPANYVSGLLFLVVLSNASALGIRVLPICIAASGTIVMVMGSIDDFPVQGKLGTYHAIVAFNF